MSDFDDFFDEPVAVDTPKRGVSSGKEGSSQKSSPPSVRKSPGPPPANSHNKKEVSPRLTDSDDSYTDFSDQNDTDDEGSTRKIEAKIPSMTKYSDESEDESPRSAGFKSDQTVSSRKETYSPEKQDSHHRKASYSGGSGTDYTISDTDSDVTDVSPLHSPHMSPKRKTGTSYHKRPPKSPANRKHTHFVDKDEGKDIFNDDSENLDLNILMQAVLEMEKTKNDQYAKDERIAKSRRVLFAPPHPNASDKKNFSFNNDRVSTIDKENQRLMQKIVKMAVEGKKKPHVIPKKKSVTTKMTPSAVNRLREQRKIEQENLAMLKRLQSTKASRNIKRDSLLKDYEYKTIAGQSVAAAHHVKSSSPYRMHMIGKRSQSMSNVQSTASVVLEDRGFQYKPRSSNAATLVTDERGDRANVVLQPKRHMRPTSASTTHSFENRGSRPSSGKQRPVSAHSGQEKRKTSANSRPDWDSGW